MSDLVTPQDFLGARDAQEIGQSGGLGPGEFPSGRREVIVAAAFVPRLMFAAAFNFFDETFFEQGLNGAIERAGSQSHTPRGLFFDAPHYGIAVQILVGQREQNVERGRGKGIEALLWHIDNRYTEDRSYCQG
jgi:hypothetical protein